MLNVECFPPSAPAPSPSQTAPYHGWLRDHPNSRADIPVRRDDGTPRGAIFIPFAYFEAAANLITNPALDPFGKIPEFKYCAVKLAKGGQASQYMGYGTNDPEINKAAIVS